MKIPYLLEKKKEKIRDLLNNIRWTFRRIWSIHPTLTFTICVFLVIQGFLPACLALVTRNLVNAVIRTVNMKDLGIQPILPWLLLSFVLVTLQVTTAIIGGYFRKRLADEVNLHITSDIMRHASLLDMTFFETPDFQNVIKRLEEHAAQELFNFMTNVLALLTTLIQLISLLAILIVIEPLLLVAVLPLLLPYQIVHLRLVRMRYRIDLHRYARHRWSLYLVRLLTGYQTVPEVKLLGLAPYFLNKFRSIMMEFRDEDRILDKRDSFVSSIFAGISNFVFYATFLRVILRSISGGLSVGDVVIYGGAASTLRGMYDNLVRLLGSTYQNTLYIKDFRSFLELSPTIHTQQDLMPTPVRGEIEFRDVSFTYPGTTRPALIDLSLHIKPGEIVALVGSNGSGKTTLAKLMAGLYSPDSGVILLDGINIEEWSLSYLHSQISFVFQNFGRYEATVADNIAYGNWQQLIDNRQKIEQIAGQANVHDIIQRMPESYDTAVGKEFGTYTLSGGQWQNIALARAFARDAALLILDEPTSNLDVQTEYELFSRFREFSKGRTTILISHRFSTVSMADRIIVLDEGRMVESGTHQELLKQGGVYARLYQLHQRQMGGKTTTNLE